MNPYTHAQISVRKRGGTIEDYYPIHFFMDSTKELCSDNRHRVLHNLWGIRRVMIPIFGHTIVNSDGREVNVKDLLEQDHVLPDYNQRFIPTLSDFVSAMAELTDEEKKEIDRTYNLYSGAPEVQDLLLSPLNVTGQLKALRLTHNTWFCNTLLPKIFPISPRLEEINQISIFEGMKFQLWMDNGNALPASSISNMTV